MTPQQRKQQFINSGETVTDWCEKHKFEKTAVYRVLNGQSPARRGKSHLIAVKLGIKPDPSKSPA